MYICIGLIDIYNFDQIIKQCNRTPAGKIHTQEFFLNYGRKYVLSGNLLKLFSIVSSIPAGKTTSPFGCSCTVPKIVFLCTDTTGASFSLFFGENLYFRGRPVVFSFFANYFKGNKTLSGRLKTW